MQIMGENYSIDELAKEAGRGILYLLGSCALIWVFLVLVGG
jgi:hypothetical protein